MRRVHAEHHASLLSCTLRTAFSLDIPSDAAPAFTLEMNEDRSAGLSGDTLDKTSAKKGGVEWRVRVCLLVCVVPDGARLRGVGYAGEHGEWAKALVPLPGPLARRPPKQHLVSASTDSLSSGGWTDWLTSAFTTTTERTYHDGDLDEEAEKVEDDVDSEDDSGWEEMRVEMVECEVPVRVWPGNTAFRAMDVIFNV
jgi:RAB6A-GEF complex partner protein 2